MKKKRRLLQEKIKRHYIYMDTPKERRRTKLPDKQSLLKYYFYVATRYLGLQQAGELATQEVLRSSGGGFTPIWLISTILARSHPRTEGTPHLRDVTRRYVGQAILLKELR